MTDDAPFPADEPILAAPGGDLGPVVDDLVPAPAYQSITTDDAAESTPEIGPAADPIGPALATLGEGLHRKLDALQARLERETRAEATREKVVDRLHAELQEYKQGLLLGILRPVFVDLIQLHDDIGKMPAAEAEPLASIRQGIEDILYRQGVEPFSEEGDAFDPRRQRALSTVPTDDPALARRVAARVRKGFQAGDKVIRPEMVTVHAYKPPPPRD